MKVVLASEFITGGVTFSHSSAVPCCLLIVLGVPFTRHNSSGDLFHSKRPRHVEVQLRELALSVIQLKLTTQT